MNASSFWNERAKKLDPYIPGEQPKDRQFIKLNTNENPYPPSPAVIEAIRSAASGSLRLYPDPSSTKLRGAIAEAAGLRPEQVFAGNGSDEILAFVFAAFFESVGGAAPVLFPDITYSFYPVYAGLWNVPFETVPLRGDFSVDMRDYFRPSGGVIFPNPNAPTGMLLGAEKLLSLAEWLEKRNRVLVVDEAYGAFAGGGIAPGMIGAESMVPYTANHPNLLTVHTFSKSGALAGLRCGFAIGHEDLIEALCRVRDSFNSYPVDALAQAGAAAAARDRAYYAGITEKIIATRERAAELLRGRGFEVLPSAANFFFARHFPGGGPGKSGAELFAALRERGILARHFNKPRIADFLRISTGTDSDMDTLVEAIVEAARD